MLELNKIYCIDALEGLKQLEDESVDCVVTSPPYNVGAGRRGSGGGPNDIFREHQKTMARFYADERPEAEYQSWQRACLEEMLRVCRGSVFYNHKIRYSIKRLGRVIHPMEWIQGLPLWEEIIWDRQGGMGIRCRRWTVADERIYMFKRPLVWNEEAARGTNIWRIRPQVQAKHPCAFPEELARRCIEATTLPGHIVLDPFCGVGTTLAVAHQLGRDWIGFDLNPGYTAEAQEYADHGLRNPEKRPKMELFANMEDNDGAKTND